MRNIRNLLVLGRFLVECHNAKIKFGMGSFARRVPDYTVGKNVCSTVCCATGHALLAGIEDTGKNLWVNLENGEDRLATVEDLFTPLAGYIYGWQSYSEAELVDDETEWDWLFSGDWEDVDNTQLGAAKRIFWLIEHGAPEEFEEGEQLLLDVLSDEILDYQNMDITKFMGENFEEVLKTLPVRD